MNPLIESIRDYIRGGQHKASRATKDWSTLVSAQDATRTARAARLFAAVLQEEAAHPTFLPGERIVLTRHCINLPDRYSEEEMSRLRKNAYFHEKGFVFNISPDYASTVQVGLDTRKEEIQARRKKAVEENDTEGIEFLDAARSGIDAVCLLADAYREEAIRLHLDDIAETLTRVPHQGATTFRQALQFIRILHFALWCEGPYHNGLGRFDQYAWPWLKADLEAGRETEESALALLEEFFLTFNRDSDLYVGVQQGDNGQSLMLGGVDRSGNESVNLLTHLCLKASRELRLIDPKINLRVSRQTPMELFAEATELTKIGLGFPQYANDDVVIPGLIDWGYSPEDARDYAVAACWEFIVPGKGMDIPNIAAVSFPAVVDSVLRSTESNSVQSFDAFLQLVRKELFARADQIESDLACVDMLECPFISTLCDGRIEAARDVSHGNVYNNFGVHGTGLAPAVDSLETIKRLVFDERIESLGNLRKYTDQNFRNEEDLLIAIRALPKLGNDEDEPDAIAVRLLNDFADSFAGRVNCRGGIFRPGTGSAMYYITHAKEIPATLDGRLRDEPFPANYSPGLHTRIKGPLSVVKSFTKPNLKRVVNGGPLTIELHDSVFRNDEGVEKVAQLVRFFVMRRGHQLQVNTINRDQLLAAKQDPEHWRHLIVRVWGWSGYFVELDRPYQDQIIQRVEMTF